MSSFHVLMPQAESFERSLEETKAEFDEKAAANIEKHANMLSELGVDALAAYWVGAVNAAEGSYTESK